MQKQNTLSAVVLRAKLGRSAESPGAFWVLMQSYLPFLKTALKKQYKKNIQATWVQYDKASASVCLREQGKPINSRQRKRTTIPSVRISQGLINTSLQPNCLVLRSPASFLLQRARKSLADGRRRGY